MLLALLMTTCWNKKLVKDDIVPKEVPLKIIVSAPQKYTDLLLNVTGLLYNAGSNYFTDLKVFLKDKQDSIRVRTWLPIETPPPATLEGKQSKVLSNYLAKEVRLRAYLRKSDDYYLEVESAEIIATRR